MVERPVLVLAKAGSQSIEVQYPSIYILNVAAR